MKKNCPPCNGNCDQGDACPARIPSEEDLNPMEQFDGIGWGEFFAGTWPIWLVLVIAVVSVTWS